MGDGRRLLKPFEVAALLRVDPKTVTRWAVIGRIGSIRTPGGHHRFLEAEVQALLEREAHGRGGCFRCRALGRVDEPPAVSECCGE
ncbi:BldC family transcriptional regulator [Micromonospora chokoriensis]